jgi:NAD(P)-dependent dehydrogenase (short-subunit alcohol dehydrogenase family)
MLERIQHDDGGGQDARLPEESDLMSAKAIFITGGGSGIGRATAQHFAARGWFIGLADVNVAGMAETAALLPAGMASQHQLDVRDRERWPVVLAEFAAASGGRMDVLFNNAGIGVGGPLPEMPLADADRVIDINFTGVVNGIHFAFPLLKATPGSAILSTCSAAGIYGSAGLSVYSATKFAVRALTEALDVEFEPYGITVRDIMPGFIDTPLLDTISPGSNQNTRETVRAAGLEFTPVEQVAEAAWNAVHGGPLHTPVGPTAKRLAFGARWMPGRLRKMMRGRAGGDRPSLLGR